MSDVTRLSGIPVVSGICSERQKGQANRLPQIGYNFEVQIPLSQIK